MTEVWVLRYESRHGNRTIAALRHEPTDAERWELLTEYVRRQWCDEPLSETETQEVMGGMASSNLVVERMQLRD